MLAENLVQVSRDPHVALFVAQTAGPARRVLLVIHGGPDWDHTYLRAPLTGLAGSCRVVFADLRGCGRSTRGLTNGQYTPDAVVADLLALLDALGVERADVLGFSYGGHLVDDPDGWLGAVGRFLGDEFSRPGTSIPAPGRWQRP